jgi:hypothetical protein
LYGIYSINLGTLKVVRFMLVVNSSYSKLFIEVINVFTMSVQSRRSAIEKFKEVAPLDWKQLACVAPTRRLSRRTELMNGPRIVIY